MADDGRRRCYRCHCILASDQERFWCSPCWGKHRRYYDPHDDPAFLSELLLCLSERPGELVEPVKLLGISEEHRVYVKSCIRRLRHDGAVISCVPREAGYRFIGFVQKGHTE